MSCYSRHMYPFRWFQGFSKSTSVYTLTVNVLAVFPSVNIACLFPCLIAARYLSMAFRVLFTEYYEAKHFCDCLLATGFLWIYLFMFLVSFMLLFSSFILLKSIHRSFLTPFFTMYIAQIFLGSSLALLIQFGFMLAIPKIF